MRITFPHLLARSRPCISLLTLAAASAFAQNKPDAPQPAVSLPSACAALQPDAARLDCYDRWAQAALPRPAMASSAASPAVVSASTDPSSAAKATPATAPPPPPASEIVRFWDLEKASAKSNYQLRGYRPISLSVASASSVNTLPFSPSNGSPANAIAYSPSELKINLSVRTKIASGLLHQDRDDQPLSDSIWFGYSQQSYWQLFSSALSRPFRATDHEPELIYVFGHNRPLPGGWTYRMSGAGVVHQSNGQSLPLSRSWNRVYLMAAADKITAQGGRFSLQAKAWQRLPESLGKDDNPDISNYIGRAELAGQWNFDTGLAKDITHHTLGLNLRHSLRSQGRGSVKLEYLRSLGHQSNGLRFHTQIFSGYGDSLIDYNRRRTVLSVGVSLVDW
jgi:phospholipase A1/A2